MERKVLFIYNAVHRENKTGYFGECMTFMAIEEMMTVLSNWATEVVQLNLRSEEQLKSCIEEQGPFTLAFCIAEGFLDFPETLFDGSGAAGVRKILESYHVPVTHSSAATMEICRQKNVTYEVLEKNGIPVPTNFAIFPTEGSIEEQLLTYEEKLNFPLFVKPSGGGNSICISEKSIVHNREELIEQILYVIDTLGPIPVVVESFLCGREYTVGVIGNTQKTVFPIIAFPDTDIVRSFAVKKAVKPDEILEEIITKNDLNYWKLYQLAVGTFDAVGGRDIIRIDIREGADGIPRVIDVNGTPTLTRRASFAFMAQSENMLYDELLYLLLDTTLSRIKGMEEQVG